MVLVTTLNDASDALVAVVNGIDADIRFFPEPVESHPTTPGVTGEIMFRLPTIKGPVRNSTWEYEAVLTLITQANKPGWPGALRRIREYASPFGPKSIYQAIVEDQTLGGVVKSCLPKQGGLANEVRVLFPGGDRWTIEMMFAVRIGPEEVSP